MALLRGHYAYSKIDNEDPEEKKHRRAQFLIQKILLQADNRTTPSFSRIRICKFKVKIGRRLKTMRKSMLVGISAARVGIYKQVICHMNPWKRLFRRGKTVVICQPSLFTPSFSS
ncbi:hypothetical protein CJ030_MR4G001414 [Morella rubra]|uniref:Uncharacterized protein n=1 Tax=Morella rubra TaxID=262757 RepID=A0A6A1VQD4_9ROSI|nr:hypothetical protein CJ030_MR4G001414 [Morella rubra]